jgi:hypothetical protein
MTRTLRAFAFALLFASLAGPTAARAKPWGALDWLDRLRSGLGSIWADNGCSLDPSGHCGTAPLVNGCGLDPNGQCGSVWAENGCSLDPDGRCGTVPRVNGCSVDPSGLCTDRR